MQSHSKLPPGVRTSIARWLMPKAGMVSMVVRSVARRRILLLCVLRSFSSVVQDWPDAGTYWRSSVQTAHEAGGLSEGEYWVPQVTQMKAGMGAGYTVPSVLCQPLQIRRLTLPRTAIAAVAIQSSSTRERTSLQINPSTAD